MKKLLFLSFMISACSGPDKKNDTLKVETKIVVAGEKGKCDGNKIPPANYRQETAFASIDTPNATDVASQKAIQRLRDKICQGYRCRALETNISIWNTERAASQVCAMAVISSKKVNTFLNAPRSEFESQIDLRGKEIVDLVNKKTKKKNIRLAVGSVRDLGVEGGERASWLVDKFLVALGTAGADTVELTEKWSGLNTPKGIDGVVTGRVTKLHGQEMMLEVTWRVKMAGSTRVIKGVEFPEMIGPVTDPSTAMQALNDTGNMSIRLDKTRSGGGMCDGDETELIIENDEKLFTRVINLYGDGSEGLLVYGSEKKLPKRTSLTIATMSVVKTTTIPVERLVIFGAKTKEGLGRFADSPIPCRIPSEDAQRLSNNSGYPDASKDYRSSTSYRILGKSSCGKEPETQQVDFSKYPTCW